MTNTIAVQEIWLQSSADYHAVKHMRTKVFKDESTVSEIMEWAKSVSCLQAGQVILAVEDIGPKED